MPPALVLHMDTGVSALIGLAVAIKENELQYHRTALEYILLSYVTGIVDALT